MKITKSTLKRLIREELKEVALGTQDIPSAIADRESAQSSLDDTKSRLKHERTRVVELTKEMSQLQQRLSAAYEDIAQGLNKHFDVN